MDVTSPTTVRRGAGPQRTKVSSRLTNDDRNAGLYPFDAAHCGGLGASGGIGRRARFRSVCPKGRGGSTPPSRTTRCGCTQLRLLRLAAAPSSAAPSRTRCCLHGGSSGGCCPYGGDVQQANRVVVAGGTWRRITRLAHRSLQDERVTALATPKLVRRHDDRLRRPPNRYVLVPANDVGGIARGLPVHFEGRQCAQQLAYSHACFEFRQRHPDAEMNAFTER